MAIQRKKRLKNEPDITPKILEEIFEEFDLAIPEAKDYKPIRQEKKVIGPEIPSGLLDGEIAVDIASSTPKIVIRIGKKMYKIADLTEIT